MSSRGIIRKLSSLTSYSVGGRRSALDKFLDIDCKSGKIDVSDAQLFFNHMLSMRPSPSISCFNTLLGGLVNCGHFSLAITLYKKLHISGVLELGSDMITLNILLNCYSSMKLGSAAYSAFGLILKNGYRPDIISFGSLLKGLVLEEKVVEALVLFSKMTRLGHAPDVFTFNTMIDGMYKTGMEEEAKSLLIEMSNHGIHPDSVTFSILINRLCKRGMMDQAMEVLEMMLLRGLLPDTVTYTTIVYGYCRIGKIDEALGLFRDMSFRGIFADSMTMNNLLKGLFHVKRVEDAISLFNNMKKMVVNRACRPDQFTYAIMIDGLGKEGRESMAGELFLEMQGSGFSADAFSYGYERGVVMYNTLINCYCRARMLGDAHSLLLEMEAKGCYPDAVTYNILINGYCKAGILEGANNLLLEMEAKGCSPNVVTFNTLISGFAAQKDYRRVKELRQKMHAMNISSNSRCDFSSGKTQ